MQDSLETFPYRKQGETRASYIRRIQNWKTRFTRELHQIKLQQPLNDNHLWIQIHDSETVEFYININQILREDDAKSNNDKDAP